MKPALLRLILAGSGIVLLCSAYYTAPSGPLMAETAKHFLSSLDPEQRAKATFAFQDQERFDWHYVPKPRKGLPLREMKPEQKHLAHALLAAGLSRRGYTKATTIMSLEEVLRILENASADYRAPEGYFFTVFGEPSETGNWGYRIEGHHLSLNFTLVNGKLAGSPDFFGANPAEVREGPRKGLRALAREEDLGRKLVTGLTPEQSAVAIVDKTAYPDILTKASRQAALKGHPNGLSAENMTSGQRDLLGLVVREYAENLAPELFEARMQQLKSAGTNVFFAWAGGTKPGEPHYYRIQAPDFLIEYDNTQNNANHIHSVWRDFRGDFGLDLLKSHYESSHR